MQERLIKQPRNPRGRQTPLNRIMVNNVAGAVEIFFDTNLYLVDRERLAEYSTKNYASGKTTDFDLDRVEYGAIVCHFNPTSMDPFLAMEAAEDVVDYIKSCTCVPGP